MPAGLTLGTRWDGVATRDPVALPAEELVTHGVVFGATGSGKTGLCLGLLEELALAGVPVLAVDFKGDLANLAMVFPRQGPEDYRPWLDEQAVRREGIAPERAVETLAASRREELGPDGLKRCAEWPHRVAVRVYTPGSLALQPIALLGSLSCPPDLTADPSARSDLVAGTVSGLLSLLGRESDPLQDPEHILLSQIVEQAWAQGLSLSLEALITRLVDPPFKRVGVFPVDTFLKPDARLALARGLNGVLASPSFAPWMQGVELDPAALTASVQGRTPISVFFLAHLSDAERMFFVSLLLQRVLAWTRGLAGTSSLRALVYLDEVMGYLPPHPADPPSKKPLMTLLKQARSVGVGVLLATQNPVDVDYKALSNAGSWWVGRLQASQDRERVADGLRGADPGLDPAELRAQFDSLQKRVFLFKSPGGGLTRVYTRPTLCYLRGPLTLGELKKLPESVSGALDLSRPSEAPAAPAALVVDYGSPGAATPTAAGAERPTPPPLPSGLESLVLDPRAVFSARLEGRFEPFALPARSDDYPVFAPALYAQVEVRFDEEKSGFLLDQMESRVYFPLDKGVAGDFLPLELESHDLLARWEGPAFYQPLPESLDELKEWQAAQKTILEDIYRNLIRGQWVNPKLKLYGRAEETREQFLDRCREAVNARIDSRAAQLQERARQRMDQLQERIRAQKARLAQHESDAAGKKTETLFQAGETLLGFFTGRRRSLSGVLSRGRTTRNAELRARSAAEDLDALEEQVEDLGLELADKLEAVKTEEEAALEAIESRPIRLDKQDVRLRRLCLLWVPLTRRV